MRESLKEISWGLCKLINYAKSKGEKGNTTLKLPVNTLKYMRILEIKVRSSINAKEVLENGVSFLFAKLGWDCN